MSCVGVALGYAMESIPLLPFVGGQGVRNLTARGAPQRVGAQGVVGIGRFISEQARNASVIVSHQACQCSVVNAIMLSLPLVISFSSHWDSGRSLSK